MNRIKHSWIKRAWMAWAASVVFIGLSGCATSMVNQATQTSTDMSRKLAFEDAILGMSQPSGEHISEEARNFLALIGQKQTYLLTEGADEIKSIVKNLDERYLGVNQGQEFIEMSVAQDSEEIQSISGDIQISYNKPNTRLTERERQVLAQLKFVATQNGQMYQRQLHLQGIIYPPVKNLKTIQSQFKQTRAVRFYQTEYKQNHNPLRVVLLPLGVAFDVITAPIQVPFWFIKMRKMQFM